MKIKESQNTQSEYAENALTHNYERKREHEKKKKRSRSLPSYSANNQETNISHCH